jgi:penicillin-binding protein 2
MAQLMSVVSNGGYFYRPSILFLKDNPEPVKHLNIKPETLAAINHALFGVVNEQGGTGWAARSQLTHICGKTGTAQVVGLKKDSQHLPELLRDHAWFVSFAPYEKPEIALSVMVEHGGHGGAAAAPIAKRAIEAYLKSTQEAASGNQTSAATTINGRRPAAVDQKPPQAMPDQKVQKEPTQ